MSNVRYVCGSRCEPIFMVDGDFKLLAYLPYPECLGEKRFLSIIPQIFTLSSYSKRDKNVPTTPLDSLNSLNSLEDLSVMRKP